MENIEEIQEIITHRWNLLDFEFLCLWEDNTCTWQSTQDLLAGNSDIVIQDYLLKLQDTGNSESFKIIFDNFATAIQLNNWWKEQMTEE